MVKRKGAIVLVTEITPQSQLFMDYLREELGIPVEMAAPDGDWSAPDGERVLVLIDVELRDLEAVAVFVGQVVQDGLDHLAWAAPLGPVVDQHRAVGLEHVVFEVAVGYMNDLVAHGGVYSLEIRRVAMLVLRMPSAGRQEWQYTMTRSPVC